MTDQFQHINLLNMIQLKYNKMIPFVVLLLISLHAAGTNAQQPRVSTAQTEHNWRAGQNRFLECHLDNAAADAEGFEWTGPALADPQRINIHREGHLSRLHISDVREEDAGEYHCSHRQAGNSPVIYTVRVLTTPTFLAGQQTEFNVPEEGDVILRCKVRRCRACTVIWRKGQQFLESTPTNEGPLRTQSLTLTRVSQEDAGMYRCTITDTNEHLQFTVNVKTHNELVPMLDKSYANSYQEVYYTDPLMLRCPVRSGENTTTNQMIVSWVFTNIHDQLQHVQGQDLFLPAMHYTRGIYKCTARNDAGEDSLEIFVEINAPPLPESVTLPTLTFGEGSPQETLDFTHTTPVALHSLSYRWERVSNGVWVSINDGDKYKIAPSGHLSILGVTLLDAGTYRVTISNEFGESVQIRRVDVSPRPTPGQPVAIGFSFQLPEGVSCSEVQATTHVLTSYLLSYLQSLCSNNDSSLPEGACSDLQVEDVNINCQDSDNTGTFRAMLKAPSAQTVVQAFEESGPTDVESGPTGRININPCGAGQCIGPTVKTVLDLVAVLTGIVSVLVLLVAMVAISVCVGCIVKHKKCCNRTRVADIENQQHVKQAQQDLAHSYAVTPHDTLGTVEMYEQHEQRYVACPTNKSEGTYV